MPLLSRLPRFALAALLIISVSGCQSILESIVPDGAGDQQEEPREQEEIDLSRYEDFDPSPYREEAPATQEEIEHDVPERLLTGRAAEGVERTVQGFRVQIISSKDKAAAEGAAAEAEQWWREHADEAPSGLFSGEGLPVYTVYRQPFYRVRVGNFTSRAEAERALEFLSSRYGDAFIARGEVTVTR